MIKVNEITTHTIYHPSVHISFHDYFQLRTTSSSPGVLPPPALIPCTFVLKPQHNGIMCQAGFLDQLGQAVIRAGVTGYGVVVSLHSLHLLGG